MLENLFIIFAPMTGGNHLANLISLTSRFSRHVDYTGYDLHKYDAHFSDVKNLQIESIQSNLHQLKKQSNVLCGHLGEYLWLEYANLTQEFPNKKFLVLELPQNNNIAIKRMNCHVEYKNGYFYNEQRTLYTQQSLSNLFNEHDWFIFKSDELFVENPHTFFQFVQNELCTDIDISTALDIHQKWFNNIQKSLARKSLKITH